MPTVNTNTAAQFALNKLNATERDMTTAMERLSSGKKIMLVMTQLVLRLLIE